MFTSEQRIICWKPPRTPAFKINVDACQKEDRTQAMGAVVIRDTEFKWVLGITTRIVLPT